MSAIVLSDSVVRKLKTGKSTRQLLRASQQLHEQLQSTHLRYQSTLIAIGIKYNPRKHSMRELTFFPGGVAGDWRSAALESNIGI